MPVNKKIKRKLRQWQYHFKKTAFPLYAHLKYNATIWRLINWQAISAFKANRPNLDPTQTKILEELRRDGISVTDLDTLFGDSDILRELQMYAAKRDDRARTNHKKPFLEDLLSEIPEVGLEIPFFKLAIDKRILDIVNSYLGMHTKLTHFMLRRTKVMNNELPTFSQNWHRAPQEQKNCRVYIYINNVDEGSGAFCYIPQSTHDKKYGHIEAQTATTKGYLTAETIERTVPKNDQLTVLGKAGTVIFCDSTGLHRGGYSTQKVRVMSTFGYSAPSFRENIHYSYTKKLKDSIAQTSPAAADVLQPKWQRSQL